MIESPKIAASSVPTPDAGYITYFVNQSGLPSFKDETGAVGNFVGPAGTISDISTVTSATTPLADSDYALVSRGGSVATKATLADLKSYIGTTGFTVKDEGSTLGTSSTVVSLNFSGDGVSATRSGTEVTVTVPAIASLDEGVTLTGTTTAVNYAGAGVTATSSGGTVTVTVPGPLYTTESRTIASPNATIPVHGLTASGSETNIDLLIAPKGTGAIIADIPDDVAAGGAKRGTYAVDLQVIRGASNQVAAGSNSVIAGGRNNRVVPPYGFATGDGNTVATSANASAAFGTSNFAGGTSSFVAGESNTSTGNNCSIFGSNNTVAGSSSSAIGDYASNHRSASVSVGSNYGATAGRYQYTGQIHAAQTTTSTAGRLQATSATAANGTTFGLVDNSAIAFRARVVARDTTTNDVKQWVVEGLVKRGSGVASTALVGTPTVTSSFGDTGASAWTLAVTADTTLGSLNFAVTGETSKTIRWTAWIDGPEVR